MSDKKITFRASEDLVERVERIEEEEEESRSEIMREAVRHYLDSRGGGIGGLGAGLEAPAGAAGGLAGAGVGAGGQTIGGAIDAMLTRKIDAMIDRKLQQRDVNVTVEMPEERAPRETTREARAAPEAPRRDTAPRRSERRGSGAAGEGAAPAASDDEKTCPQCGEAVEDDHVHCPNCGAKTSQRVFCDCGDEVRSDWSFCPSCGRRTPSSHALQPPE